jgi:hypothetical protein
LRAPAADFLFMDVLHKEQKQEANEADMDLSNFLNKSTTGGPLPLLPSSVERAAPSLRI